MVLPARLISAIKQRASDRGQSITAYISALARADLDQASESTISLPERLQNLESRLQRLEQRLNVDTNTNTHDHDHDHDQV
jgi:BMFP domain-containing protein YqiC